MTASSVPSGSARGRRARSVSCCRRSQSSSAGPRRDPLPSASAPPARSRRGGRGGSAVRRESVCADLAGAGAGAAPTPTPIGVRGGGDAACQDSRASEKGAAQEARG